MTLLNGRMNRLTYWICLGVAVAVFAGIAALGKKPPAMAELVLIWLCVPRLHDIGLSGRWAGAVIAAEILVLIVAAVMLSKQGVLIAAGIFVVVALALMMVLGAIPGQSGENRFGPPPRGLRSKMQPTLLSNFD